MVQYTFEKFWKETEYFSELNADDCELLRKVSKQAKSLENNKDELKSLIKYIDLTTLSGDDTPAKVIQLASKAILPYPQQPDIRCAAVCVYPARILDVVKYLKKENQDLEIASVAGGFPSGQYHLASRLLEVKLAVGDGANEIDTVINRAAALDGQWETVFDELKQMKELCQAPVKLKVILAVGDLKTNENVHKASWAAMLAGADFIKTSTGKEDVNATLEYSLVMCKAIKRFHQLTGCKIGFKPAGGIKTISDAISYRCVVEEVLGNAWISSEYFRIGASSLLDNITKHLNP
ncbi:deoC/LacD family aldolase domain-containing protein [Ditylenchus destructor]|uniref:deoxyribose-phosphate aldolase n=1 Tax=Ditylenchus destructor TaxID=166010 RepID=A0AAD4RA33_9BILA|nr:deoC/LacD family aldolase domain-containing protein [Ditylenchus destructor]